MFSLNPHLRDIWCLMISCYDGVTFTHINTINIQGTLFFRDDLAIANWIRKNFMIKSLKTPQHNRITWYKIGIKNPKTILRKLSLLF